MSNERKLTPEEATAILGPMFARLVATHGKHDAMRIFRQAVVAAGLDPQECRVIFDEDLS